MSLVFSSTEDLFILVRKMVWEGWGKMRLTEDLVI